VYLIALQVKDLIHSDVCTDIGSAAVVYLDSEREKYTFHKVHENRFHSLLERELEGVGLDINDHGAFLLRKDLIYEPMIQA
jgi:hypothetical protein